jgi:hypothetical protein
VVPRWRWWWRGPDTYVGSENDPIEEFSVIPRSSYVVDGDGYLWVSRGQQTLRIYGPHEWRFVGPNPPGQLGGVTVYNERIVDPEG